MKKLGSLAAQLTLMMIGANIAFEFIRNIEREIRKKKGEVLLDEMTTKQLKEIIREVIKEDEA